MCDASFAAILSRPKSGHVESESCEPDYEKMREILRKYPRHVEGKIIQQGGYSILHNEEHRWLLPPQKVHELLAAANAYWNA